MLYSNYKKSYFRTIRCYTISQKKLEILEEYQKTNVKLDVYYDCYLSGSNTD